MLRLHFANGEGPGVLAPDRLLVRRRELARMLADARAAAPHAKLLRGGSWLYHLAPYRTLFPPSFLATATPANPRNHLGSGSLWGQFLRGDGGLYEPRVAVFVRAFERATTPDELAAAFPLPRLDLLGSIETSWPGWRTRTGERQIAVRPFAPLQLTTSACSWQRAWVRERTALSTQLMSTRIASRSPR